MYIYISTGRPAERMKYFDTQIRTSVRLDTSMIHRLHRQDTSMIQQLGLQLLRISARLIRTNSRLREHASRNPHVCNACLRDSRGG